MKQSEIIALLERRIADLEAQVRLLNARPTALQAPPVMPSPWPILSPSPMYVGDPPPTWPSPFAVTCASGRQQ